MMFNGSDINPTPNFSAFSRTHNTGFFNHIRPFYNNERKLYDLLITESYNKHAVCCDYFIVTDNIDYDKLFGEDNDRYITKRLTNVMIYFILPKETKNFTLQGIEWSETLHAYISKRHFRTTSILQYEEYMPRISDIVKSQYNDLYFEIISVKDQEEQFLQGQHAWDIILKPIRDNHLSTSADTSTSGISATTLEQYIDQPDLFDITEKIDEEKESVNYKEKPGECAPRLPDGWW